MTNKSVNIEEFTKQFEEAFKITTKPTINDVLMFKQQSTRAKLSGITMMSILAEEKKKERAKIAEEKTRLAYERQRILKEKKILKEKNEQEIKRKKELIKETKLRATEAKVRNAEAKAALAEKKALAIEAKARLAETKATLVEDKNIASEQKIRIMKEDKRRMKEEKIKKDKERKERIARRIKDASLRESLAIEKKLNEQLRLADACLRIAEASVRCEELKEKLVETVDGDEYYDAEETTVITQSQSIHSVTLNTQHDVQVVSPLTETTSQ